MTKVAILPVPSNDGNVMYCAVANGKHSQGSTPGQALDSLTPQLSPNERGTIIVVQSREPDSFFGADQQHRLTELMARWRLLRDQRQTLPSPEQAELEALVDAELRGAAGRSKALADEMKR